MLYVDRYNQIRIAKTENEILLFSLLQELKLFKGENPTDIERGIDYIAVFNFQAFLRIEAQNVCNKYIDKFQSLELGEVIQNEEKYEVSLNCVFKDGSISENIIQIVA